MSRKEPSFGQLASYMSSEKSDSHFDLYHHCYSRRASDISGEFSENGELLPKRKNGNYLYHEVISLEVAPGSDQELYKEALREIARKYIEMRCPQNMVYGCLHEDHSHNLHYHLMISANERGARRRSRLTKAQFDKLKRELETEVLENYPHLKQRQLITATSHCEKMSVKAGEMKRRTGTVPQREQVKQTLHEAMSQTKSMDNFIFFLSERGYAFYTRGKNFGVQVEHESGATRKYRFSTLGVHEEFQAFQGRVFINQKAEKFAEARNEEVKESEVASDTSADTLKSEEETQDMTESLKEELQRQRDSWNDTSKDDDQSL